MKTITIRPRPEEPSKSQNAPTLDEVIDELQDAGLLITTGEALSLRDAPEVRSELDTMAHIFEDPTGRQELLRRLYRHAAIPL